jgi:hypothetical protein
MEITIWDFKTHQKIKTFPIGGLYSNCCAKSLTLLMDGRLAVGVFKRADDDYMNDNHTISIYNLETGECEQELHDTKVYHIAHLSDGRLCSCVASCLDIW